jgi:TPR repeat protein
MRLNDSRAALTRLFVAALLALCLLAPAQAASLGAGIAAYDRQDFNAAAAIFRPLALAGDPRAQSYLGYMYSTGRGLPQNFITAAYWYFRAANQGETTAQYQLGLLYDKGDGVQQDYIKAHMWLDLAAAHAPPRSRDFCARLRDAIATKMTRGQIGVARQLALEWVPVRERRGVAVAPVPPVPN